MILAEKLDELEQLYERLLEDHWSARRRYKLGWTMNENQTVTDEAPKP